MFLQRISAVSHEENRSPNMPVRIWNPAFISVFISNILTLMGQTICNTLVSRYAYHLGATSTVVGVVASSFALSALVLKFISAPALDTFNRKNVLFGGMCVVGAAFIAYSMSTSIPELIISRLIQGAGQAFTATCFLALAADTLPLAKLNTGIGYFSLGRVACMAIAPPLALKLAETLGYSLTFILAAFFVFAGAISVKRIKINFVRTKKFSLSPRNIIAKEALLPAAILFFIFMANYCIISFLIIYSDSMGIGADIGYFYTIYAIVLFFIRPAVGKIADTGGIFRILMVSLFCFASAFMLISFSDRLWMFLAAALLYAMGYGVCYPLAQSMCMKLVPEERRGAGSCTCYIGMDLGNLVGPVVAGFFAEQFGFNVMWRMQIIPVVLAAIVLILFRNRKQIKEILN
ncbi:MAG: MFS transporter [Clostridia bacterium]|nr:MFS transporter [Clostridia bacterium]